jgi:hypothetical protein
MIIFFIESFKIKSLFYDYPIFFIQPKYINLYSLSLIIPLLNNIQNKL